MSNKRMENKEEEKLEKERKRDKLRYESRKEYRKKYNREYMKEYSKREYQLNKKRIRRMTHYYYGIVPSGYHRHHINYDSPHDFVLITTKEHGIINRKINRKIIN